MSSREDQGIKDIVTAALAGKRIKVNRLIKEEPELAAFVSKMVLGKQTTNFDSSGQMRFPPPPLSQMRQKSEQIEINISDAESVMDMLTDLRIAEDIYVSSVISPKEQTKTELTFQGVDDDIFPADVNSTILGALTTHFKTTYKIEKKLYTILRDSIFRKGSYPILVLPENAVDHVINNPGNIGLESIKEVLFDKDGLKSYNLLGNPDEPNKSAGDDYKGLSLEDFGVAPKTKKDTAYNPVFKPGFESIQEQATAFQSRYAKENNIDLSKGNRIDFLNRPLGAVTFTDNIDVLKVPMLRERLQKSRVESAYGTSNMHARAGLEAYGADERERISDIRMQSLMYKERAQTTKNIVALPTQDQLKRRSITNANVIDAPSESFFLVHVRGKPNKPIGAFIAIDQEGYFVCREANPNYYEKFARTGNPAYHGNSASGQIQRVRNEYGDGDCGEYATFNYGGKIYGDMFVKEIYARLRNGGAYGSSFDIGNLEDASMLMFHRQLANLNTQLVWVPAEYFTYFAFRYSPDGFGVSVLDSMKILNSLRLTLMFSNARASLRNSIGITNIDIELEENDQTPENTVEQITQMAVMAAQMALPVGITNPVDLNNTVASSGIRVGWSGNSRIPTVKTTVTESGSSYIKPDTEIEEEYRKRSLWGAGVQPELIDRAWEGELATSVVNSSIMMTKRVMKTQELFLPQLDDHLRKYARNSEKLVTEIQDIIVQNYQKFDKDRIREALNVTAEEVNDTLLEKIAPVYLTDLYMNGFSAMLPSPGVVTLENQKAAMDIYKDSLIECIGWIIDPLFMNQTLVGEASNEVETVKNSLVAYFMRQYMADNGILPELAEITMSDENGDPKLQFVEQQAEHLKSLMASMTGLMAMVNKAKAKTDSNIEKLQAGEELSGATGSVESGSGGGDTGSDTSSDTQPEENPNDTGGESDFDDLP